VPSYEILPPPSFGDDCVRITRYTVRSADVWAARSTDTRSIDPYENLFGAGSIRNRGCVDLTRSVTWRIDRADRSASRDAPKLAEARQKNRSREQICRIAVIRGIDYRNATARRFSRTSPPSPSSPYVCSLGNELIKWEGRSVARRGEFYLYNRDIPLRSLFV